MTDLVDDDILYSGRGKKKDTPWSDDHNLSDDHGDHFIFSDVVYKSYLVENQKRDEVDPYDMDYHNLLNKHFVLSKVKPCGYCNVKRFLPFAADKEKWRCICQMFL
jgi:hypothetical protein